MTYLLHVGRGYHSLGKADSGIPYLDRAIESSVTSIDLNQLLFECEAALGDAEARIDVRRPRKTLIESTVAADRR